MEVGVVHLLEASIKLNCSPEVTARSLMIYHHFRRCAAGIMHNEDVIAAAALSLAASQYKQYLDLDTLISVFYSTVVRKKVVIIADDPVYINLKKTLISLEFLMLRQFEFDMNHRLAYEYLGLFLPMIFERSKNIADFHRDLGFTCLRILSDFYTQPLCLEFSPELAAIACIDLSLHVHGLLTDLTMSPAWYTGFICHVTPDKVKAVRKILMNLYEKPTKTVLALDYLRASQEQIAKSAKQAPASAQKNMLIHGQQVPPIPMQQVPPTLMQQVPPTPMQQVSPTSMQQVPPTLMRQVPPIPMQQIPRTAMHILPARMQKLLSTSMLIPSRQGLPVLPRQQFSPSRFQQFETIDITDPSSQKS